MNVLLCVVIIVLGLGVFLGYKQGLIKMIATLLVATLAVSLVSFVSPYISKWIQEKTSIKESVQNKVVKILVSEEEEDILEKDFVREEQISLLENAAVPEMFRQSLLENNNHEAYAMLGVKTFGEYVGAYIAKVISDLLAFVISFVVVMILAIVLVKMLGLIDKLPLIGGMNRVAGGALGTMVGLMAIWILFLIITILYDTSFGQACFEQIGQNKILTFLYDENVLMKYVTKF